ncbi:MAG TPA: hypothetical protein PLF99_09200 [Tenuifilaceae bacterium]|nr:hypothetical protein [Tenuifilaceae bacterium]HPI71493.1 hypothetical protein [Tenuifilaceae bacterium]
MVFEVINGSIMVNMSDNQAFAKPTVVIWLCFTPYGCEAERFGYFFRITLGSSLPTLKTGTGGWN